MNYKLIHGSSRTRTWSVQTELHVFYLHIKEFQLILELVFKWMEAEMVTQVIALFSSIYLSPTSTLYTLYLEFIFALNIRVRTCVDKGTILLNESSNLI